MRKIRSREVNGRFFWLYELFPGELMPEGVKYWWKNVQDCWPEEKVVDDFEKVCKRNELMDRVYLADRGGEPWFIVLEEAGSNEFGEVCP